MINLSASHRATSLNAAVIVFAGLFILMTLSLAAVAYDRAVDAVLLAIVLGILLIAPLFLAGLRGRFDPLESIYFFLPMFGYAFLAKPMIRLLSDDRFLYGESYLAEAFVNAIIGLVLFYLGYYSRLGVSLASHIPTMDTEVSAKRVRACAWACILIGSAALWAYMEISGGWQEFWALPHGYGGKANLTTAYIYQLPELMLVGFFLIALQVMHDRSIGRLVEFSLASIGGVGVYTILWGRRTFVIWILVALFIMFYLRRQKAPGLVAVLALGFIIFAAVSLTLAYRSEIHLNSSLEDFQRVNPLDTAISAISQTGDEFDSFLAIVALYPDRIPYDHFWLYAQIPLHPIPRLIWPGKPELFVSSWDEFLFSSGLSIGASESLLGDLYIQLGTLGIVFGMFVVGVLWRFFYAYLQRAPRAEFMQVLYAVALGNVPSLVMQGGVSAFWKWMPFFLPGIVLIYLISKRKMPWAPVAKPVGV